MHYQGFFQKKNVMLLGPDVGCLWSHLKGGSILGAGVYGSHHLLHLLSFSPLSASRFKEMIFYFLPLSDMICGGRA